jgi:hypothetical protein
VADKALDSHPHHVDFLREWDVYPSVTSQQRERRREWLRSEMQRIEREGIAPLFAALTAPLSMQVDECVGVLDESRRSVWLRLVEGAEPPDTDPQGQLLPSDLRGKVLRAKLGNVNGDGMSGTVRATIIGSRRPLYRTMDITAEPRSMSLSDAVLVLRQWGYRVRQSEFYHRGERMQSRWLVVQVREDGSPFAPQASTGAADSARTDAAKGRR